MQKVNDASLAYRILKKYRISLKDSVVIMGLMSFVTLLALIARKSGFSEANIIMIFLLGVFLVSFKTTGFSSGIMASVIGVLFFNFFFTEPRFTLAVHDPGYLITFPIMLIVSLITSTLTSRIQVQAEISSARERRTDILFQISRSLLRTRGTGELIAQSSDHLFKLFNREVLFYLAQGQGELKDPLKDYERAVVHWVYTHQKNAGKGTDVFPEAEGFYLPVKGKEGLLGIIGIKGSLEPEQQVFLENVVAQIALALDRERLSEEQEHSKVEIEKETLRSNLLQSISHDLRTPITGIAGASSTLLENPNTLDPDVVKKLLMDINQDSQWLIRLVENLLSMTRLDEGKMIIDKNFEAIEEIISEALRRVNNRVIDHQITLDIPDKLILVPMDGNLIVQVIINLIDNALKYTPKGTKIEVRVSEEQEQVVFEIADEGPGIPPEAIHKIFDRFYTTHMRAGETRRGIGLGLAICKSIVKAHGGSIEALNQQEGGAIFRFSLPYEAQDPFGLDDREES